MDSALGSRRNQHTHTDDGEQQQREHCHDHRHARLVVPSCKRVCHFCLLASTPFYWQLIDKPETACEQLFKRTVVTSVAIGFSFVSGSLYEDWMVSTALTVSIVAIVDELPENVTGNGTGTPV